MNVTTKAVRAPEQSAVMTNEEMLRFLSFVDQIDAEADIGLGLPNDNACYRMSIFLIRQHLEAKLVTVTALEQVRVFALDDVESADSRSDMHADAVGIGVRYLQVRHFHRFFRRGKARYEDREVHEHMTVDGAVGYLKHDMEHNDRRGLADYIAKHNKYSTLEAREMFRVERAQASGGIKYSFWGGPIERRRWIKHKLWPKLPARWLFRFFFMYVMRLGVLDGATGFHFCLFMAGYEHQISLKLKELRRAARAQSAE